MPPKPIRAPRANAIAERWVKTVKTECLDWMLILGERHLASVLKEYVKHYNRFRPHRGLELRCPVPQSDPGALPIRMKRGSYSLGFDRHLSAHTDTLGNFGGSWFVLVPEVYIISEFRKCTQISIKLGFQY
jgi:hypothetical protein